MHKYLRYLAIIALFFSFQNDTFATHNRAGEIIVHQIGGCNSLMVRCSIITYTKASSYAADRDTLTLCFGDGDCVQVPRSNGPLGGPGSTPNGEELGNDIKYNVYWADHTFPGRGTYQISMTDPNRNSGVLNVNFPGSENVQFHLQTTYTFLDPQFQGCNDTPILLQPPVDIACIGQKFIHNPNAYDPDGDSLSYQLVEPMQDVDTPVPNYVWPQFVQGNEGSALNLNSITGDLTWDAPLKPGEYNIAMIIISWRNGVPIDTVLRDMQIFVEDCGDNKPPIIATVDRLCVVAGEFISFDVVATDPDLGDKIKLSALGGPFEVAHSPAANEEIWRPFGNPSAEYENQPVTRTFQWQTSCEHISNQEYTIIFKAVDNYFDTIGLTTLKTVRIKVVGPPPEDVQAEPNSERIELSWESPYVCEDALDDYFFGFSVWRREGSNQFPIDTCTPGLEGKGYTLIVQNTVSQQDGRYYYVDSDVERGRTYCYRILAKFAKLTDLDPPQRYNEVESLPSNEVCVQLSRDVPLITNVSIITTATSNGEIQVKWTKPVAEDLDTLQNGGLYRYQLLRAEGFTDKEEDFKEIPGASFTSPTFWQLTQNEYLDSDVDLNTAENPYTYKIDFYVNGEDAPLGHSPEASSVFLSIASTDETNNLSWDFETPWDNFEYVVYRQQSFAPFEYDSIGFVQEPFYSDQGLLNGREYCYFVEARGSYGVQGIPSPLINLSQKDCGIPLDTIPPCPPELEVRNICDDNITCEDENNLENRLRWINPMNLCEETDDVVYYNIYYAALEGEEFELIGSGTTSLDTAFIHQPERGIAGCYAVTAVDTFHNESRFSNIFCVDNCPNYTLPNTFTPNNDGYNDLFIPFPYCFIESIDIQIYNRWGGLVFETKDPNINWDGINLKGEDLPDGTYYYTCRVFEQRVAGITPAQEILKGSIDLIRGR